MSELRRQLRADLVSAMRGGDAERRDALRALIAAIENAEAVPTTSSAGAVEESAVGVGSAEAQRRVLTPADEHAIVLAQASEASDAAAAVEQSDPARARALRDLARLYLSHVPPPPQD